MRVLFAAEYGGTRIATRSEAATFILPLETVPGVVAACPRDHRRGMLAGATANCRG